MQIKDLLIGRKLNGNAGDFHKFFFGNQLRKDKDKDGIPYGMDCNDNNFFRDAPIIPQSLQQRRPQKPQTLAQYTASRLPIEQVSQEDTGLQQRYEEAKKLLEGSSMDDYESRYAKIPDELKQYFTNPNELKSSKEYQEYQQQVNQYNEAQEYNTALQVYLGIIKRPSGFVETSEIARRAAEDAQNKYGGGYVSPGRLSRQERQDIEFFTSKGFTFTQDEPVKPTKPQGTTSVYIGGKEYKNVPTDVALKVVKGDHSLLEKYGYVNPQKLAEFNRQAEELRKEDTYFGHLKKAVESGVEFVKSYINPDKPQVVIDLDKGTMEPYKPPEQIVPGKNFGKPGEKYDLSSNTFYSVSPTGEEGTLYIRPPTAKEKILIEEQLKKQGEVTSGIGRAVTTGVYDLLPEQTRKDVGRFGLSVQEGIQSFGRKVSAETLRLMGDQELKRRYEAEERISNFGNELNSQSELLKREASIINQQDAIAVEEFNKKVEEFNLKLKEYETTVDEYESGRTEQEQNPSLRGLVSVFGEFEKKQGI